MKRNSIVIDVDDTILTTFNRDYVNSTPHQDVINIINRLHRNGWHVTLYTARGQLSMNGDLEKIETEVRPILEEWLEKHDVRYDVLLMGKPYANTYYVDDKALRPDEFVEKFK